MDITQKLRFLREEKGGSQHYVALKLKVSQQAYQKIETDESKLTISKLRAILQVLESDLQTFFTPNTTDDRISVILEEIIDMKKKIANFEKLLKRIKKGHK